MIVADFRFLKQGDAHHHRGSGISWRFSVADLQAHHEYGDSSLQATGQNHLFRQEGAFEMDAQQPYHPGTKGQCQQIRRCYERQKEKQDQSLF